MRKPALFITLLVTIIIALSILQVVISNSLSTTGLELGRLDDDVRQYKKENMLLKEELLVLTALTQISSSAAELGFVDKSAEIYIKTPLPLAKKQ